MKPKEVKARLEEIFDREFELFDTEEEKNVMCEDTGTHVILWFPSDDMGYRLRYEPKGLRHSVAAEGKTFKKCLEKFKKNMREGITRCRRTMDRYRAVIQTMEGNDEEA